MSTPDPPRRAAALRYDKGADPAPKLVAAGAGHVADRILALAREHGVPVREDAALADALARLRLDLDVPPELYAAVAEALVWAYALDVRAR
ncbi:MAG TPA: EscU/YscU/HrcU family type III secretion system export apparatus switch protein [Solirubrobacteraceae bacterium]|nr:EscU/YscU/HrcU family type III secretion system export apparatus switch protein [Solirubrobacteraceae bacterium]